MIQLPMVLQAYTPQIYLGDWQIVIFVNRRRGKILVERWHSSEKSFHPMEGSGQVLRITTGIRAFRRQMPVLATALEKVQVADLSDEQIVRAVFRVLASVYKAVPERDELCIGDDSLCEAEFTEFLQEQEKAALLALKADTIH